MMVEACPNISDILSPYYFLSYFSISFIVQDNLASIIGYSLNNIFFNYSSLRLFATPSLLLLVYLVVSD